MKYILKKFIRWLYKGDDWNELTDSMWYDIYKEIKFNEQFKSERERTLEQIAGGYLEPNPKLIRNWKEGELPLAPPDTPFFVFIPFKKQNKGGEV